MERSAREKHLMPIECGRMCARKRSHWNNWQGLIIGWRRSSIRSAKFADLFSSALAMDDLEPASLVDSRTRMRALLSSKLRGDKSAKIAVLSHAVDGDQAIDNHQLAIVLCTVPLSQNPRGAGTVGQRNQR